MGTVSTRKRYIEAIAKCYVEQRFGTCMTNASMAKGLTRRAIVRYATNWLSQHGELPQGTHVLKPGTSGFTTDMKVEIDFTALWRRVPSSRRVAPPLA